MEQIQDWATYISQTHRAPHYYISYAQQAFGYASTANGYLSTIKSYLLLLINQVSEKPDLATIALLLIIFFISLKILNMLLQTVLFWFRMARRLVFWGGLVGLAVWMYTRGPEGAAADLQYWYDTWTVEYEHWKEQERVARLMQQQQAQFGQRGQRWY
ncbi:uncharacterized protein MYCFIDRAFT_86383 [Pseudocercospora fijiensis CIRAD86]|uniref:Uncharacterized protein n=1 Tax=Pseudocercospora fijiensis (strain CIRAD86) TaxID=383855 RepID=N1Q9C9_PSEFD|nr:uncharacterized protein MYCFIDRAFT_86383 [Pseudocercospora fijiensis CIRAD86]EME89479.1 hypothetical protein MYCFIDRAFT_86383 [Pseudocercospora fijiensis CIRAD86]